MSPATLQAPGAGLREKGDHLLWFLPCVVSTLSSNIASLAKPPPSVSAADLGPAPLSSLITHTAKHNHLISICFSCSTEYSTRTQTWRVLSPTECSAPNTGSGPKLVLMKYLWDGSMNEWIILEWNHVLLWHCTGLHLRPRGSSLTHHITESSFFKPNFPTDPISSFWRVTRGPMTTFEETSVCMKEGFWRWESSPPGYKSRLQHFLAVWPWVNYFTFLGLSSLMDKVEMTMTLCRFFQWLNAIT